MTNANIRKVGISDGILNGSGLGINIVNTLLLATQFQSSALVLFSGFTFLFCAVFELPISYWADQNGVRRSLKCAYFSSIMWACSIVLANYVAFHKIDALYYPSILFYAISCALSNAFFKGTFQTAYLDWFNKQCPNENINLFVESFAYSIKWKYIIPTIMLTTTILLKLYTEYSMPLILVMIFLTMVLRFYPTYKDLGLSDISGEVIPKRNRLNLRHLVESTANTRPETAVYAYSVITRNFIQAVLIAKCSLFMGAVTSTTTWISGIVIALAINFLNLSVSSIFFSKLKKWKNIQDIRWYGTFGITVFSAVCLGLFLFFDNGYVKISSIVVFCLFTQTLADSLKYEIESNVKQFVQNNYRASWFGAGNLLSHLCYAFITGIIWYLGHHEYDVHLIFSALFIYGSILLITSSKQLQVAKPFKRKVSLQTHFINKYLFFLIPTGFFLSGWLLFYWLNTKGIY